MDAVATGDGEYWCPLEDTESNAMPTLAPDVRQALIRFARGEAIPDAQKDQLCALGFADIQRGRYVLTSFGSTTAGK